MPDRSSFWPPVPEWGSVRLETAGVRMTIARPATMHLVSGAVDPLPVRFGVGRASGPVDIIDLSRYALRIAPDRVLVVSEQPLEIDCGWREDGLAVSDLSDGHVCIDVTGGRARELLGYCTDYDFTGAPGGPVESSQMLLAGLRVAIARQAEGWRLHVERPWAAALWRWLEAGIENMNTGAGPELEQEIGHG